MKDRERWKCKCGAILLVLPDPDPNLVWKDLKSPNGPITNWDYSNNKWWHYHTGEGKDFSKGFTPAKQSGAS